MTQQEAINNILKPINTPDGQFILYGFNFIPNDNNFILFFYKGTKRFEFWNIDCSICERFGGWRRLASTKFNTKNKT